MVDLLPSLTDTEEKLFDESNLLHLSTKRGKEKMTPWWISVTILLLSYHPLVRYLCRFQNIKNLGKLLSDFSSVLFVFWSVTNLRRTQQMILMSLNNKESLIDRYILFCDTLIVYFNH